jgi:hypothetical protein
MSFESLSFRHVIHINDFPERWLPLIHLYDPDLPLFPVYYFHALSDKTISRPTYGDRVFGYVEKFNLTGHQNVEITIVCNKDLSLPRNSLCKDIAENEVKERFGLNNRITQSQISSAFSAPLANTNAVLSELWNRVVKYSYDNILPFGRLWDEVLGLTRFVASWYSSGGRKGELIQTHYFASKFGERIQSAGNISGIDFYLLPTIDEVTDTSNPLSIFPNFSKLVEVANLFQHNNCTLLNINGLQISKFNKTTAGSLNTSQILSLLKAAYIPVNRQTHAIECFNTFDKGPQRTVIYLLMLSDLRNGRIKHSLLNNAQLGSIYDGLSNSYQSPKVIHIYAQQCFGNEMAMPIDTWIDSFFKYPLNIYSRVPKKHVFANIFSTSSSLGKVERLLWVTAQARKVHSSACNDAIWCTKYASNRAIRGANPFACKICLTAIRLVCPAYNEIKNKVVRFNQPVQNTGEFSITTSLKNNTSSGQSFVSCSGRSIYNDILDDFSVADNPNGFSTYPSANHTSGAPLTVEQFIAAY